METDRQRKRLITNEQQHYSSSNSIAAPQHRSIVLANMTQLPRISTEEMPVPEDFSSSNSTTAPQHRSIVLANMTQLPRISKEEIPVPTKLQQERGPADRTTTQSWQRLPHRPNSSHEGSWFYEQGPAPDTTFESTGDTNTELRTPFRVVVVVNVISQALHQFLGFAGAHVATAPHCRSITAFAILVLAIVADQLWREGAAETK